MAPMDFRQNATPLLDAVASCVRKINDYSTPHYAVQKFSFEILSLEFAEPLFRGQKSSCLVGSLNLLVSQGTKTDAKDFKSI